MSCRRLYRDKRTGIIFGVCSGIAEYFGIGTLLVRLIAVISLFFSAGLTVIVYLALTVLMRVKPDYVIYEEGCRYRRGRYDSERY